MRGSRLKQVTTPPLYLRLYSVWYRHMRVYTKNLITNGFPPFLEPLIFLAAIGVGLGKYVTEMRGMGYLPFLASGLLVTASMFTAAFECSYGTFIRLEYDKAYDGMISVVFHNSFGREGDLEGPRDPDKRNLIVLGTMPLEGIQCALHQFRTDKVIKAGHDDGKTESFRRYLTFKCSGHLFPPPFDLRLHCPGH